MKFLHIINVRWYNATAWYAVNLSRILRDYNHEVIVAGLPGSPPILKAKEYGLKTFELDFNSNNPLVILKNISNVNRLITDFKPDIVVCHRGEFFWYFALKRWLSKRFKLVRVRGDRRKPKTDLINRFLHNNCTDLIITSGDFIRSIYLNEMKVPEHKVKTIYGGVDTSKFRFSLEGRKRVRDEFGFDENDFVVGIVGRFDYVKGHEDLIKAVSVIYHEKGVKNIKLFLIGFDTTIKTDDIKNMLNKYKIEEISKISGFRNDIVDCMSALDLGVVASHGSEAICRVGFELMSVGIPVVASNVGVLPEIIPNENIYPAKNVEKLIEKILNHKKEINLFSDEDFYSQFIEAIESLK
ncbi:glycosyltransferase family 4 protein [Deferribacter autotrophicus]|uniref:Glycosyltransferase family 4 protein n=1 Tax=Deferribacter autotrophicus TaxID=500465 RepID=A0A5A8F7L6_9BACT|nr:glycosyltransferase [Deferribacter autotrophicus]KAA0257866.1 glycosyltransferase family 4 protein [Deferribacter autotrophicus]